MTPKIPWATAMLIAVACGCDSPDERLVRLSEQTVDRQAEQNRQIAQQSQQVAEAAKLLVEADARARSEMIDAQAVSQQGLQDERSRLDLQHEDLEKERRALAAARHREPIIADAISAAALLLGCLLPVVVCIYLLRALDRPVSDSELSELLVREITSHDSPFLSGHDPDRHAAIAGSTAPLLPPAEEQQ